MSITPTVSHILPSHFITEGQKNKKKKRHREDDIGAEDIGERLKEKKKKRKTRHSEQGDPAVQPAADLAFPSLATVQHIDNLHVKKSKKDKGKQPESSQPIESAHHSIDPSLALNAQTSAAALISAIVAAATGTQDPALPDHTQPPLEPHYIDPHSSQHFMPYPFMPYSYGAPPYSSQNTMPPPTFFSAPPNVSFSELTFGSNDDVLRALQALDMSKITNVLKTLEEATASAGEPPSAMQPQPTSLGQIPATSGAILGQDQNSSVRHTRTLDMRTPGPEHQTLPDHAYVLATKWLNTSKLSELVRTEGWMIYLRYPLFSFRPRFGL